MKNYEIPYTVASEKEHNKSQDVQFRNLLTKQFAESNKTLLIALGEGEKHNKVYLDLCETGHLIMTGVPKSGKSICIQTILSSLLLKNSPEQLKLVLIDPKKTELESYSDLPHLAMPILKEPKTSVAGLKWVVDEIEKRKDLFKKVGISNFSEYENSVASTQVRIPHIVIVVDEYADIIREYGVEATDLLVKIAHKGCPAGIHLILSTMRPTIDTITGALKANISTRIAFRVARDIYSKVIIDQTGAETLKGKGDMLLKYNNECIHLQGAYIDEFEILEICDYIKENYSSSYLVSLEELNKIEVSLPKKETEDEELIYQVALYCIETNIVSINAIQMNFCIGFNRAAAIIKELEKRNIVSPKNGNSGRKILVDIVGLKTIMDI